MRFGCLKRERFVVGGMEAIFNAVGKGADVLFFWGPVVESVRTPSR